MINQMPSGSKISFHYFNSQQFRIHGIFYRPESSIKALAIFTHGYTSCLHDLLKWGERLQMLGIASFIFDLPGHYLGKSSEVTNFLNFTQDSWKIFENAYLFCCQQLKNEGDNVPLILGGHSLGSLLAFKAAQSKIFKTKNKLFVGVGAWMNTSEDNHLFEDKFYEKTLTLRAQYVCPELNPANVFSWIKNEKEKLSLTGEKIYLLTGLDDVVAGGVGAEKFKELMLKLNNQVYLERPNHLSHHRPELAAPHLAALLKKFLEGKNIF